jgi:hypothetical protein
MILRATVIAVEVVTRLKVVRSTKSAEQELLLNWQSARKMPKANNSGTEQNVKQSMIR